MVPLAICSGLVLIPCALRPGLIPSVILWAGCGACSTFVLIQAQTLLTRSVPNTRRGKISGLVSGGLQASQGIAVLVAGVAGEQVGVYRAVGLVGAITAASAVLLGVLWRRARPRSDKSDRGEHGGHEMSDTEVRGPGYALAHPLPESGRFEQSRQTYE
jgi:MFS family permease